MVLGAKVFGTGVVVIIISFITAITINPREDDFRRAAFWFLLPEFIIQAGITIWWIWS